MCVWVCSFNSQWFILRILKRVKQLNASSLSFSSKLLASKIIKEFAGEPKNGWLTGYIDIRYICTFGEHIKQSTHTKCSAFCCAAESMSEKCGDEWIEIAKKNPVKQRYVYSILHWTNGRAHIHARPCVYCHHSEKSVHNNLLSAFFCLSIPYGRKFVRLKECWLHFLWH